MALAVYNPYVDRYDNPQPDISELGLQWVSELNSPEEAFSEFKKLVGIDDQWSGADFEYVRLPSGANNWPNGRVNRFARSSV